MPPGAATKRWRCHRPPIPPLRPRHCLRPNPSSATPGEKDRGAGPGGALAGWDPASRVPHLTPADGGATAQDRRRARAQPATDRHERGAGEVDAMVEDVVKGIEIELSRERGVRPGVDPPPGFAIPRPRALATMERKPRPEPRRDKYALCQTAGTAAHGTGLRPSGHRTPSPHRRPERLHRARYTCHRARRIGLSGERGTSAASGVVQQSP